ncbi:hypothetical protein MNBD_GAMMA11-2191 [hydrothermal vent metagenome]|uniref:Cell division protein ZapA n=1 Tax=hydrothermal vent metagenome TaxID=652676 RepID=A0A3B0Y8X3_9ZZZZ
MGDSTGLNIKIMDKDYSVACPPEQQASLRNSAEFLNERLKVIKNRGSIIGNERIAIMAALNLAHELLSSQHCEGELSDIDLRMLNLQKKIDIALSEIDVA